MHPSNEHMSAGGEQRGYLQAHQGEGRAGEIKGGKETWEVEQSEDTVGTDGRLLKSSLPPLGSRHPVCRGLGPWNSQTHMTGHSVFQ